MKHWIQFLALMLVLGMGACSSEEKFLEEQNNQEGMEITEIVAVINGLNFEGLESRTIINMGESSISKPVWADKDTIGIYPAQGDQLSFPIVDGVGTSTCIFNGGGWALKGSTTYTAYSPFNRAYYYKDNDKLPVSMLGQKQVGNNNSDHLGKYDLQIAKSATPESGKAKFTFEHQVCFVRMDLKAPVAAVWKSITLESDALFTTEVSMNLSLATPTLTATTMTNSVMLDLENVSTQANETITAYMVVLPVNLTDKSLDVILVDSEGNRFRTKAVITNDYRNFKAGYARWITANDFPTETNDIPYVTFTAADVQSLTMSQAVSTLEYSVDGSEWAELGTKTIAFGGEYGNLRLRGKNKYGTASKYYIYSNVLFGNAAPVACTGDIRTLLDYENHTTVNTEYAMFCGLFYNCSNLTSAPELPATIIASQCYYNMFNGCTNLVSAPELPAKVMAESCYSSMFSGCNSLTSAPDLPATTLAEKCYSDMFKNCINLTLTPKLPAATLAKSCYSSMFYGCTKLTSVSDLPATVLTESCYSSMFSGCSNLTFAPKLPAITLPDACYYSMFQDCTALKDAPELPATTLGESCYSFMFEGCSNLTSVPKLPATILNKRCYLGMFANCISLSAAPELPAKVLAEYCYGQDGLMDGGMFEGCVNLTKSPVLPATTLAKGCYGSMFNGCSSLTSAPELPATTLAESCYGSMFFGCTNLKDAPELPATTLAKSCYSSMFQDCTNLISAPELPAMILAEGCYMHMFYRCESLIVAPSLPATILANSCYSSMFNYCTSLKSIPILPATTLAEYCYNYMFSNCTSIEKAPDLPAITLVLGCYGGMFSNCTSLTTAPVLPATTLVKNCYSRSGYYLGGMFEGCKKLNNVIMLATDISTEDCLVNWLKGVSSIGTFTKAKEMESLPTGANGIPSGWEVKNYND